MNRESRPEHGSLVPCSGELFCWKTPFSAQLPATETGRHAQRPWCLQVSLLEPVPVHALDGGLVEGLSFAMNRKERKREKEVDAEINSTEAKGNFLVVGALLANIKDCKVLLICS